MQRIAVAGDQTTTGGHVIRGTSTVFDEKQRPYALKSDLATCGNCKGGFPIYGSANDCLVDGRPMVKHLDRVMCPCGKNFVLASATSTFLFTSGGEASTSADKPEKKGNEKAACWFLVRDATTGERLVNQSFIANVAGIRQAGITDESGYAMIETNGEQSVSIHAIYSSPKRPLGTTKETDRANGVRRRTLDFCLLYDRQHQRSSC